MTIASAFNEIAVAQGGTASSSGTIAGAIDALTDALAGSDVQSPSTIEGAVRLLGEHIGGGGGSTHKLYFAQGSIIAQSASDLLSGATLAIVDDTMEIEGETVQTKSITAPTGALLSLNYAGDMASSEAEAGTMDGNDYGIAVDIYGDGSASTFRIVMPSVDCYFGLYQ